MAHKSREPGRGMLLRKQAADFLRFSKNEENSPEKNLTLAGEVVSY
jgi:hypothetical protein